jgi:hypothetical protein
VSYCGVVDWRHGITPFLTFFCRLETQTSVLRLLSLFSLLHSSHTAHFSLALPISLSLFALFVRLAQKQGTQKANTHIHIYAHLASLIEYS